MVIGAVFIGVVPSPPDELPRNTLYVTPPVGLALHVNTTECIPVPDRLIVSGEFGALLAMPTLPLLAPPDVGANVTVSVADCPGVRIVPFTMPLALKPTPTMVTPEIVTLAFPLLVTEVVICLLL